MLESILYYAALFVTIVGAPVAITLPLWYDWVFPPARRLPKPRPLEPQDFWTWRGR